MAHFAFGLVKIIYKLIATFRNTIEIIKSSAALLTALEQILFDNGKDEQLNYSRRSVKRENLYKRHNCVRKIIFSKV